MPEQLEKPIAQWRQALAEKIGNDPKILDELIAFMATGLLPSGWLRRFLLYALTNAVKRLQQD